MSDLSAQLKTPLAMFYQWENQTPDKLFLRQPFEGRGHDFTWKEAGEEIRKLAKVIQQQNLPQKSNISLVSKNCAYWIIADLAIMMAGHQSVPIYPNVKADTLRFILEHSASEILLVGKLDDWSSMKAGVPKGVTCISFPMFGPQQDDFLYWEKLVNKNNLIEHNPDRDLNEIMSIIYTSGTTGNPKGVVHTFKSFAWAAQMGKSHINFDIGKERLFSYLPLSHIAERMLVESIGIYTNGEIWFAESIDLFLKNLAEAQPTIFLAVPRIWTKFQMGILSKMSQNRMNLLLRLPIVNQIVKQKIKKSLGLQRCKHFVTGAAPIAPSLVAWWSKLDVELEEVYGMTENCAISHANRHPDFKLGTQGKPMPGVEMKLSDSGEILIKVPCMMQGYYKDEELTAQTLKDGWLHTGDKGELDEQGFLKITGRVKEIFKTDKGKYVAPAPIEMSIMKNYYVEQVCLVGMSLPQPIALIVLSQEAKNKNKSYIRKSLEKTLSLVNPNLEKHEKVEKIIVLQEDWTIENDMLTPTMKIKRARIENKFQNRYDFWFSQKESIYFEEN